MLQLVRRRTTIALGFAVFAAAQSLADVPPRRVVSLNLCGDQMLLALADRGQILSLTPLSQDPALSFLASAARGMPTNQGKGEAILFGGADLVLMASFGSQATRALLAAQGVPLIAMDPWQNIEAGRTQIRMFAQRLGHPERGERIISEIDDALTRAKDIVPSKRSILIYYRRGWVPSSNSVISEILLHMGFRLHQGALGLDQGGFARLENVIADPPDYVLLDDAAGQALDNGSALLAHPALADILFFDRRLILPSVLTICEGPSTARMIDRLSAQVRAKVH